MPTKNSLLPVMAGTLLLALTVAAHAEPMACGSGVECAAPTVSEGETSSTQGFVGLQWNFGSSGPEVTAGVRWLQAGDDDSVYGAQVDASVPLTSDFLPKLRLLGLYGTETVQGQFGGGYDFGEGQIFGAIGMQLPYVHVGADVALNGAIEVVAGASSLAAPTFADGAASCPANYTPTQVSGSAGSYTIPQPGDVGVAGVDDNYVVDGVVCASWL